ncbi:hypothetical protein M422DRAFT_777627 [Sphaerobolus stellatus SS14]|nr:hypothetical protein M422DRAFT_777627 [Sphaerobolus stellatus SS14]
MVVAIAPWSLVIKPGKKVVHEVFRDIQITNAALGAELEDAKARSTLKVTYAPPPVSESEDEDEETEKPQKKVNVALCSLTPGAVEQAPLNVTFTEDEIVEFEVVGKNSIHLFGNYIDQNNMDFPPSDDEDDDDDESVNLLDVSSDVEIDAADYGSDISDDESRFEEVDEETPAAKSAAKRPRDSTAMETDAPAAGEKATKKQKAENGSAVLVTSDEAKPESKKEKKKKEKKAKADGTAASSSPSKEDAEKNPKAEASPLKELSGGLKYRDVKVGSGKQAKAGNTVSMRYIGKLTSGKIFDSNTKGKPFTFKLGKGEVIKGWDLGIAGMQVGGERLLIIPANLAYGKQGTQGIPGNATLQFECKLLEIKGN